MKPIIINEEKTEEQSSTRTEKKSSPRGITCCVEYIYFDWSNVKYLYFDWSNIKYLHFNWSNHYTISHPLGIIFLNEKN